MVDRESARTAVGITGNAISFFLFMSPVPTFWQIWNEKSVGEFKADPYLATLFNCAVWVLYGLPVVTKDNLLVYTINGCGFAIELFYVSLFLIYSKRPTRIKILVILVVELVIMSVIVGVVIGAFHSRSVRGDIVGVIGIIFNAMMYTSPLTIMKRVIKTKSVKYMPLLLSIANFANGAIWLCYALIQFDLFLTIGNGIGTLSGILQLLLYARFYRTTNWDESEEEEEEQYEVEFPQTSTVNNT